MSAAKHTPMVVAAARVLCKRGADECNVDFEDSWKVHGNSYLEDARLALEAAAAPELLEALHHARAHILIDRTALSDTHMNPVTNTVDDEDGIEGLAQYDAVLAVIDAVIAKATGSEE